MRSLLGVMVCVRVYEVVCACEHGVGNIEKVPSACVVKVYVGRNV